MNKMTREAAIIGGYVGLYVFLDWLSWLPKFSGYGITPWNPPPGLSLAFLLIFGVKYAPVLFVSAFIAEIMVRDFFQHPTTTFLLAISVSACYGLAAFMLVERLKVTARLREWRDLANVLAVGSLAAFIAGGLYIGIMFADGRIPLERVGAAVIDFWIGDVIGIAVVTPFILVHGANLLHPERYALTFVTTLQAAAIALVLWVVFGPGYDHAFKLFYLLFLPLIWIAIQHGLRGATLGIAATQGGLIIALNFTSQSGNILSEMQFLMLTLAISGLALGVAVDGRRRAERRLLAQQAEIASISRLNSIVTMASAVSHDINQPLSAIVAYVRASKEILKSGRDNLLQVNEALDKAMHQANRAGAIVARIRNFIGRGRFEREEVNLGKIAREAIELLAPDLDKDEVKIRLDLSDGGPDIYADPLQIQQVIVNLVKNSQEAIAQSNSALREIKISVASDKPGFIQVVIADSGPGLSEESMERLFEPFMTSKPAGMGLGLAICRTIIEGHGGRLWAENLFLGGAAFHFVLPIAHDGDEVG
jgi:two-component system sensor kinase FixL